MTVFHYHEKKRSETTFPIRHNNLILMVLKTVPLAIHYITVTHVIITIIISESKIIQSSEK